MDSISTKNISISNNIKQTKPEQTSMQNSMNSLYLVVSRQWLTTKYVLEFYIEARYSMEQLT